MQQQGSSIKATEKEYKILRKKALSSKASEDFSREDITILTDLQAELKALTKKVTKLAELVATVNSRTQKLWVKSVQEDLRKGSDDR